MAEPRVWTPEEIDLLMKYGACFVCHAPRKPQIEQTDEDGQSVFRSRLICLNGHVTPAP